MEPTLDHVFESHNGTTTFNIEPALRQILAIVVISIVEMKVEEAGNVSVQSTGCWEVRLNEHTILRELADWIF